MIVLLSRIEKYKMKECFSQFILFSQRKYQKMADNYDLIRGATLFKKLFNLLQKTKQKNFNKIIKYSKAKRQQTKKLKIIFIIGAQYIKNVKQACFNRLRMYNKQLTRTNLPPTKYHYPSNTSVTPLK
jgi:hypothetical protein